ncbi:MAG: heavy metal translocating P-type ATPase [Candidatus Omnitrophica bacterium]|nr:heavy metal translocating P-type ATPase [Candidatus Omnitrophota bacterium]
MKYGKELYIAFLAIFAIGSYLFLRLGTDLSQDSSSWPLWIALGVGGIPLVWDLLKKLSRRQFGSDVLAGISIIASVCLGEYLAGTLVVLMLSGGEALESFAVRRASSVLAALAKRMPNQAHRKGGNALVDITIDQIAIGDELVVLPHEICPVDGEVVEGHGVMDESYLTGEPFVISKGPGSVVLSGAVNGDASIIIRATKRALDSRYAKIMEVMRAAEEKRPSIQRLGDQLGIIYTPIALVLAMGAWILSHDPIRFLSVLVIATPCPLLIAIPVAVIGSISLCARRGIIIRNPAILEQVDHCRTIILDKTGTLTYGRPVVTKVNCFNGFDKSQALKYAASLEQYSKHPLARSIVEAALKEKTGLIKAGQISEAAGEGLKGVIDGHGVLITSRGKLIKKGKEAWFKDIPQGGGLECVLVMDDQLAAHFCFHDEPRREGKSFIQHLNPRHKVTRTMIVSGDRESEVAYLAEKVGINSIYAGQSPEEKINIVRRETALGPTMYLGDGINDAPALTAATVGIAFGQNSDITAEAAGAVIMESSLTKVDELMHISRRMRFIAMQSAVGGMIVSVLGMLLAAVGQLTPVEGAIAQEIIDVLAVLNALRAALAPKELTDFT